MSSISYAIALRHVNGYSIQLGDSGSRERLETTSEPKPLHVVEETDTYSAGSLWTHRETSSDTESERSIHCAERVGCERTYSTETNGTSSSKMDADSPLGPPSLDPILPSFAEAFGKIGRAHV